jgi:hypothetical protein
VLKSVAAAVSDTAAIRLATTSLLFIFEISFGSVAQVETALAHAESAYRKRGNV